MISNLKSIYSYFIFVGIFIVLMSIMFFFATRKYNKKRIRLFALFASLDKRSIVLISTFILNFTLVSFFSIKSFYFNDFVIYLMIVNIVISIIISLNIRVSISNIIYSLMSIFSLKIVNIVYTYLSSIYYDRLTFVLGAIFVLMVIVYELFITFRLTEIVLKNKDKIGGFYGRKSKSKK